MNDLSKVDLEEIRDDIHCALPVKNYLPNSENRVPISLKDAKSLILMAQQYLTLKSVLKRGITLAGHPDAAQGCRNIIKLNSEAIGQDSEVDGH